MVTHEELCTLTHELMFNCLGWFGPSGIQLMQYQIEFLQRYNQAIAADYILPLRILR